MKIGIIGAGNIAGTVGGLWARAGHAVRYGVRHPETADPALTRDGAAVGTIADAARFGDVVFCSVPYGVWPDLSRELGPLVGGKLVVDSANPYPERDGEFARKVLDAGQGSGVPIAALLPGTRFVRAFNSVYFKTLQAEAHRAGDRIGIPVAGDDADAVATVAGLVRDAGFAPVIVGLLDRARSFDPGTPVYNTGMSGAELARALGSDPASASGDQRP